MPIVQLPVTCPDIKSDGIRLTKGDTRSYQVALGKDLTGATVQITIQRSPTSTTFFLTKLATILSPFADGNARFDFVPSDVSGIPAGFYYFFITTTIGFAQTTDVTGQFVLEPTNQSLVGNIVPIMQLAITKSTERVGLELRDRDGVLANPTTMNLQVLDEDDHLITDVDFPDPAIRNPQGGIFTTDLTSNRVGDFLVIWTSRYPDEEPVKTIKDVRFVSGEMFRMIPEVLLYIDKSRKATNKPIAFNAVDVAEYIENALRDFNATTPTTSIHLEELADEYKEVIIQGCIKQALIAQGLLSVDQDFAYNDNGISLTIDHSVKLQSWYTTLMQSYVRKKEQYKLNMFQPHVLARSIVGTAFALGFSKIPAGSSARFRGWI